MPERVGTSDVSVLLGHSGWLRRLAAHLVRGGDGGDDAAQETWVAALRAKPSPEQDLRPWLARVLKNSLRRQARTKQRRRKREELATALEPRSAEPGAAALERLDLQRHLTELVAELDEPYRTTVVMRFFEEKCAAEIARQLDVPEGTVRWRTKEALDRLRLRLDERHGDRKAWSALLLPLAREWAQWTEKAARRTPAALVAGIAAVAAVAVGSVALINRASDRRDGQGPPGGTFLPQFAGAGGSAAASRALAQIDGIVFGPDGKPLPGAVVTARESNLSTPGRHSYRTESPLPAGFTTAGAGGRFRLSGLPAGRYVVAAAHPRHAGAYLTDVETSRSGPIELRLGSDGTVLEGLITDDGGGPIAGARVMVQGRWLATFMAFTSASGAYRLVLSDPASGVVVTADGYAPARLQSRVPAGERRDFALAAGARVSGRVLAEGRPVTGAVVRLMPSGMGPYDHWERQSTTDSDGRFTFTDLTASDYRPFARHAGLVTTARTMVSPRAGGEEKIELALEPGVTVRGQVRDSSGQRVPNAGIAVLEAKDGGGLREARGAVAEVYADENGRFLFEDLPPGKLELKPAAVGYHGRVQPVSLGQPAAVAVDLVLEPMAGVTGIVYRSDGTVAVNAQVRGQSRPAEGRGGGMLSSARSDANGRFIMEGLGSGVVALTAWSGLQAAVLGPFPLQAGERKEVTINLAPGAVVSGRVRWEDGRPAAGARVLGRGEKLDPAPGESVSYEIMIEPVRTNAEGNVSLGPFLPGKVTLSAFAPGEREIMNSAPRPNQATAVVEAGQQVGGLEMVISAGLQRLAGTTVGPTGKPVAGATIIAERQLPGQTAYASSAFARRSTSGGDGAFLVEGLSGGEFTVFARHPDYPDVQVAGVRAGSQDLRLQFPKPAQLHGAVTTRAGKAVEDCFVTVDPVLAPGEARPDERDLPRIDLKHPKGAFVVARLAPGRYQVLVTTPDGQMAQATDVALGAGESRRLRLIVQPGATLVGRVVDDASGAPAATVEVAVRLPGLRRVSTTTDQGGAFTLKSVPAGDNVRVTAYRESPTPATARAEVAVPQLGATVEVGTLRLRPRAP